MPFLPLFIAQLGVTGVGSIALWTGASLGVTPGLTALLAPAWGRLGDRYGRKIMVERSMLSFVVLMTSMAFVTRAWHVFAIRVVQGVFAGYGSLSLAMAAESAPRDRMSSAIGTVQTAQRLGPAIGPVIGGGLAALVGLRRSFLVTAAFYAIGLICVRIMYDDHAGAGKARTPASAENPDQPVSFRSVLAFQNFGLMLVVIFGLQFVDRSFGPILPLYIEEAGVTHARVPLVAGVLFSIMACAGALGHHFCGRLLKRLSPRVVISAGALLAAGGSGLVAASGRVSLMCLASTLLGLGIGAAMTASYTAAGSVIPARAHGAGFGVLTSASLVGMASSPFIAGFLGGTSIRAVFLVNLVMMTVVAGVIHKGMTDAARGSLTVETGQPSVTDY